MFFNLVFFKYFVTSDFCKLKMLFHVFFHNHDHILDLCPEVSYHLFLSYFPTK